jgi:hypothetical protein
VPVKRRAVSLLSLLIAVRFREDPVLRVLETIVMVDVNGLMAFLALLLLSRSMRCGMWLPVTGTLV